MMHSIDKQSLMAEQDAISALHDSSQHDSSRHGLHPSLDSESTNTSHPQRKLTMIDGIAIIVGIIIGSGIFSSPGLALERSGSAGADLIAWAVSGVLVNLCAQCYLELGGMMPSAGGDFDYITRAYGNAFGFSFAWYNFFIGKTGSQAIIATIFGRYFSSILEGNTSSLTDGNNHDESILVKLLAVGLIVFITLLNCIGIKESAVVSILMTTIKIALVLMVFLFSVIYAASSTKHAINFNYNFSPSSTFNGSNSLTSFGTAMIACLWCFDGFADGNFLQEEMIHPIRDLPRIIQIGLTLVTTCYILINIGYLTVLSKQDIIDSKAIAVQFGDTVSDMFTTGKDVFPIILALGVSMSTVGALNGSIMTGGRAFYAVARAGKFPTILAKLNTRNSPYVALIAQGAWAIVLLMLPGSNFSTLLDYFGPTSWLYYALTASAVIVLRYREPHVHRPFTVPWYPLPPVCVIIIALVIFVSSLMNEPLYTVLAISFVILSFPVYFFMEYYKDSQGTASSLVPDHVFKHEPLANHDEEEYADR